MAAQIKAHRKAQLKYESKPEEVKKRENRNLARHHLESEGKVRKGDGVDVGHKDGNALNNSPKNWIAEKRHKNRAYARDKGAGKLDSQS